jgi:hypothetical protein
VAVFGQVGTPDRRRPRADKAEIYEPRSVYPIACTTAGLSGALLFARLHESQSRADCDHIENGMRCIGRQAQSL